MIEYWKYPQRILVFLAHPDDPEFFCGATIASWIKRGHEVSYCIFTHGEKGSQDVQMIPETLAAIREIEQNNAARILGVQNVKFLSYLDGCLEAGSEMRRDVVRVIRQEKPNILVTSDPTNFFIDSSHINHPDHRIAGQVVIEAAFPAAGNPHYFPELLESGLEPHQLEEIWLTHTVCPDFSIDVTEFWGIKIRALHEHCSQIGDPIAFDQRMFNRHTKDSNKDKPRYEERFRRFCLQK